MAQSKPVTPNFRDVDKAAVSRAQNLSQGGRQDPLTAPEGARSSESKKGEKYVRWSERITVNAAYRTVSKSGLLDVVVISKLRQTSKDNTGKSLFAHYYMNTAADVSEGHQRMNENSETAIVSLLIATGLMPSSGALKASLLAKMFPEKGKPGEAPSPLAGKAAIAMIVQQWQPKTDKNGKAIKEDGKVVLAPRDGAEGFLPDMIDADEDEE